MADQETLLRDELIRDEGIRLRVYYDTRGVPTIGIGRNLRDKGITFTEADYLFRNDVAEVRAGLRRVIPWYEGLDDVRRRVLLNMAFNLGVSGLRGFRRMLAAAEAGDFARAAAEMADSAWYGQVKGRGRRLRAMMLTGTTEGQT